MSEDRQGRRSAGDVIGSYALAYGLGILLVAVPVYLAGVWDVLAFTRILDPLIDVGIVQYKDLDMGIVAGVGTPEHYLMSQDPIHWGLVGLCAVIYLLFSLVKAVQFHQIARLYGLRGSFGTHARAYFYGQGLNRLLPFATGDVATVAALEGQGERRDRAESVVFVQDRFVNFEIVFFFAAALVFAGWSAAASEIFWACVFAIVLWAVMRPAMPRRPRGVESPGARFLRVLANEPLTLVGLCALSIVAFLFEELTPYVISQAFTSENVILNTPLLLIHGGVLAGYIASRVPVTPGGIGQYEFGFATALVVGGAAMKTAIAIVILTGIVRHGIALLLFVAVRAGYGIETTLRAVMDRFRGLDAAGAVAGGAR